MSGKLANFFKINEQTCGASLALLLLRLVVGAAFVIHGWGKIQHPFDWMGPGAPVPGVFQFLAAFSEFAGGIAWALGLISSLASLGILVTMLVAVLTHVFMFKHPFVDLQGGHSYELASVYLMVAFVFLLVGPGKISFDHKIFGIRK